jgi:hypothetical protein
MAEVMGHWHKTKQRCHKCGRSRDMVYVITDPPITGVFCSRFCYEAARGEYEQATANKDAK